MGRTGEQIAAWWLLSRGFRILDRNRRVGAGEVDLIVSDGRPMVVEVRTSTGLPDPIDAVRTEKRRRVHQLSGRIGIDRVAMLGIGIHTWGFEAHWVPE